jgi:crotonobetainyl-CoA:carnitine CoA-transferase CaiB-like acyl-CoA transferase
MLDNEFLTRNSDEWAKRLEDADIAFDRAAHFKDVATDEQAWVNDFIFERTYRNGNTGIMTRTPVQFKSMKVSNPSPDTRLGAHTKEVLLDLGYTESKIKELEDKKIVKCAL